MEKYINIGSRREVFWDDTMIDTEKTTTLFRLHEPIQRECVLTFDQPWAGPYGSFLNVLQDGDLYRMYLPMCKNGVVYAESRDGIHWDLPSQGIVEVNGSTENPMLFDMEELKAAGFDDHFDAFRVFIDDNPECKPEERYKAVANGDKTLWGFYSPDGIHFKMMGLIKIEGSLDSVNTVFYNMETATYQAFIRHFHPQSVPNEPWIRDIRFCESKEIYPSDGKPWPVAQRLQYDCTTDWQMYINSIMKYYRAHHVYIGFPSRYVQRRQWTENYDELCGREKRQERLKMSDSRYALAVTDTLFMTSRDGLHWKRYPEAFLRPGPEHPQNWVYGSVYFSNGIVETKSAHEGCDNEISFYCIENRWSDKPRQVL